jgi:hypothetical protein
MKCSSSIIEFNDFANIINLLVREKMHQNTRSPFKYST